MDTKLIQELIRQALAARQNAYAPYSHFKVGASLLTDTGEIFSGANVENASYGATICAERSAILQAIFHGQKQIAAIAIVGFAEDSKIDYAYPCGICRQVLNEFSTAKTIIIVAKSIETYEVYTMAEMLPHGFGPDNL